MAGGQVARRIKPEIWTVRRPCVVAADAEPAEPASVEPADRSGEFDRLLSPSFRRQPAAR
jgi:hypothetical protein